MGKLKIIGDYVVSNCVRDLVPGQIFVMMSEGERQEFMVIRDNQIESYITETFDEDNYVILLSLETFEITAISKKYMVVPLEATLTLKN